MSLPKDIARCSNVDCGIRHTCARWRDWQSPRSDYVFSDFQPKTNKAGCEHFIEWKVRGAGLPRARPANARATPPASATDE